MEGKLMWAPRPIVKTELNALLRKSKLSKKEFSESLVEYLITELNYSKEDFENNLKKS